MDDEEMMGVDTYLQGWGEPWPGREYLLLWHDVVSRLSRFTSPDLMDREVFIFSIHSPSGESRQ